ncbi:MAG: hypothetical protein ACKOC5_04660 [Chloroflexota bacterium]
MPRLSVICLRIALLYLAAGFTLGMLMLVNKGLPLGAWAWGLLPAHIELLLSGWTLHLALGVAFWILPRFSRGPRRGDERLVWAALLLLNLGLWLVIAAPALGAAAGKWSVPAGRAAQAAAAAAFARHAWPRVKPAGA